MKAARGGIVDVKAGGLSLVLASEQLLQFALCSWADLKSLSHAKAVTTVSAFGLRLVAQQSLPRDLSTVCSIKYAASVGCPGKEELPVQTHTLTNGLFKEVLWYLDSDAESRPCNSCSTTGSFCAQVCESPRATVGWHIAVIFGVLL